MFRLFVLATTLSVIATCSKYSPAPTAPAGKVATLSKPTNLRLENLTDVSVRFLWDAVEGATDYDLNYKELPDGSWTNIPHRGTAAFHDFDGLESGIKYRWAVKADREKEKSQWAFGSSFVVPQAEDSFEIKIIFSDEIVFSEEWMEEQIEFYKEIELSPEEWDLPEVQEFPEEAKHIILEAARIWEAVIMDYRLGEASDAYFAPDWIEYPEYDDMIIFAYASAGKFKNGSYAVPWSYSRDLAKYDMPGGGDISFGAHLFEGIRASEKGSRNNQCAINIFRMIAVHEIGHILGLVGGIYRKEYFVKDGAFVGSNAMKMFGDKPIPLDWLAHHWDFSLFSNTVMTSASGDLYAGDRCFSEDQHDFVTNIEVAALNDLGYEVDYTAAKPHRMASENKPSGKIADSKYRCAGISTIRLTPLSVLATRAWEQ